MTSHVEEGSRAAQKERTRQALLEAGLEMAAQHGFGQLSLRQVAREAGVVPTAFYRHFASMDELGLTLVQESFQTLRDMIRDAQNDPQTFADIIDASAEILVRVVKQNKAHFAFVARERWSGSDPVRQAIHSELELFIAELATVLATLPNIENWSAGDVKMVAGLFVRNMVYRAEQVVQTPDDRPDLDDEIRRKARREMRMIVLGFDQWNPRST